MDQIVLSGRAPRRSNGQLIKTSLICAGCIGLAAATAWSSAALQGGLRGMARRAATAGLNQLERIRSAEPSLADVQVGVYGGGSKTFPSNIKLEQPGGTDMTLQGVDWDSAPFKSPPYHGFRGTWWSRHASSFGTMLDLTYIKVIGEKNKTVRQSGARDGAPVRAKETLSTTFRRLEFTNGLNLLTLNGVFRLPSLFGWVRPYVGIGAGLSIPHVEVRRANAEQRTFEFQVTGLAFQVLAGLEWRVHDRFSAFSEYKLSYAMNDADLVDGGSLVTNLWTNQYVLGASGHVRRPEALAFR